LSYILVDRSIRVLALGSGFTQLKNQIHFNGEGFARLIVGIV